MKKLHASLILVAVVATAIALYPRQEAERSPQHVEGLPWQIETLPDGGSRVFGLALPGSTLVDARERFGTDMELAVIAVADEPGALEAYYSQITAGVLTGKMILGTALAPETLARFKERALKAEYLESGARKFILSRDDLPAAYQAPLATITFIPSAGFDEAIVLQRFGTPAERIRTSERTEHFLYPAKGLDLILDSEGKEVLQYVAPREFEHLRKPLPDGGDTTH